MRARKSFALWLFACALTAVLGFQQYQLWFGTEGIAYLRMQEALYQEQLQKNDKLFAKNERLRVRIHQIKHSDEAMEGVLRRQLHMVRADETFIRYAGL
jgi:cell division protein FtsB